MPVLMITGWTLVLLLLVIIVGLCLPDGRRHEQPPADTEPAAPLPTRQVPVRRPTGPLPLPRAFRRHDVPAHEDPPLDQSELAHVIARWPHLVSSYYQESHHEH